MCKPEHKADHLKTLLADLRACKLASIKTRMSSVSSAYWKWYRKLLKQKSIQEKCLKQPHVERE